MTGLKQRKNCFPGISFQNLYPSGNYRELPLRENVWGKHEQTFLSQSGLRFPLDFPGAKVKDVMRAEVGGAGREQAGFNGACVERHRGHLHKRPLGEAWCKCPGARWDGKTK